MLDLGKHDLTAMVAAVDRAIAAGGKIDAAALLKKLSGPGRGAVVAAAPAVVMETVLRAWRQAPASILDRATRVVASEFIKKVAGAEIQRRILAAQREAAPSLGGRK